MTVQPVATHEEATALAEDLASFRSAVYSMRLVMDGRAIGYIVRSASDGAEIRGWGHAQWRNKAVELAWETHPDHRGQGYMREAAPKFLETLLSRPGVEKAYAWIPAHNAASQEVAKACGMTLTEEQGGQARCGWCTAASAITLEAGPPGR